MDSSRKNTQILGEFGKYILLDRIAQGGMAEIFRAKKQEDSFSNLIVIKRILSDYGDQPEFLQMFRSEINVSLGLHHPNIVRVIDFGQEDGLPYIAMEYVDGPNLRQLIQKLKEKKIEIPIEFFLWIAEQAAEALHYAHHYSDPVSGKMLQVVHRDISPQNILLSYDGAVKIIDFGIAKATTNVEATRVGIIKGKPSYLSPEQISGEILDMRSDLFSLGAVLWELLVLRKLFVSEDGSDFSVMRMIENCDHHIEPPSLYHKSVTRELDLILLRLLAKRREKRFQTGMELQKSLKKLRYENFPNSSMSQFHAFLLKIFDDEILKDQDKKKSWESDLKITLKKPKLPEGTLNLERKPPRKPDLSQSIAHPIKEEKINLKKVFFSTLGLVFGLFGFLNYIEKKDSVPEALQRVASSVTQSHQKFQIMLFPFAEGVEFWIDGKKIDYENQILEIPMNQEVTVEARSSWSLESSKKFYITKSDPNSVVVRWILEPKVKGFWSLNAQPEAEAEVRVIESSLKLPKSFTFKTPFEKIPFPVGKFEIFLKNDFLKMGKKFLLEVRADELLEHSVILDNLQSN